jgi:hypothetical protein
LLLYACGDKRYQIDHLRISNLINFDKNLNKSANLEIKNKKEREKNACFNLRKSIKEKRKRRIADEIRYKLQFQNKITEHKL